MMNAQQFTKARQVLSFAQREEIEHELKETHSTIPTYERISDEYQASQISFNVFSASMDYALFMWMEYLEDKPN